MEVFFGFNNSYVSFRSNDQWQELQTPEGRTYYWNPQTNATAWTKPTELNSQVGLEAVVPDQEELLPNYADYAAEIAARKAVSVM